MMTPAISAFPLRSARVHEAFGPSATSFGAIVAAHLGGNVLWLRESWISEDLNPLGLSAFFDPARLLVARTPNQTETLAAAEEALRDGAAPLVVMELTAPLSLTAGRRLQLAAKAGGSIGLCLIPEGMGSNAAETRWHCAPIFDSGAESDSTLQCWKLIKNKSGTNGAWNVRWEHKTRCLAVVSPARE